MTWLITGLSLKKWRLNFASFSFSAFLWAYFRGLTYVQRPELGSKVKGGSNMAAMCARENTSCKTRVQDLWIPPIITRTYKSEYSNLMRPKAYQVTNIWPHLSKSIHKFCQITATVDMGQLLSPIVINGFPRGKKSTKRQFGRPCVGFPMI